MAGKFPNSMPRYLIKCWLSLLMRPNVSRMYEPGTSTLS